MTNKQPFFSIITCTKNSAKFLPSCLSSLSSQTFRDFEHIVIDGESTDKTRSLIPKSSRLFVLPPNGISAAMNEGIKRAKGRYIYFLHSDDYLHDDSVLSNVANFLQAHPDLAWAYGQIQTIDSQDHGIGIFPKYKILQLASSTLLSYLNYIPHQAVFVQKHVFSQYGLFAKKYKFCMDYDYWLRISNNTKWSFFPYIVASYRLHNDAMSSSIANRSAIEQEFLSIQLSKLQNPISRVIAKLVQFVLNHYNSTLK